MPGARPGSREAERSQAGSSLCRAWRGHRQRGQAGKSQTRRVLPPEQGSLRGPAGQSWLLGHTCWRVRDGVSTCWWGSRPAPAPPHASCSLKPRTTEPGKAGQGLCEQWGEGAGLKPRMARAPGSGCLTPRCAISGGWAEEGQKARRVEKCKGKSVPMGSVGKTCSLLHWRWGEKGRGWKEAEDHLSGQRQGERAFGGGRGESGWKGPCRP